MPILLIISFVLLLGILSLVSVTCWKVASKAIKYINRTYGLIFWFLIMSYVTALYSFLSCFENPSVSSFFYPSIFTFFILPIFLFLLYGLWYPSNKTLFFLLFSVVILSVSALQYKTKRHLSTQLYYYKNLYLRSYDELGWETMERWIHLSKQNRTTFETELESTYYQLWLNDEKEMIATLVGNMFTQSEFDDFQKDNPPFLEDGIPNQQRINAHKTQEDTLSIFEVQISCDPIIDIPKYSKDKIADKELEDYYINQTFKLWAKYYQHSGDIIITNTAFMDVLKRNQLLNYWCELAEEDPQQIHLMKAFLRRMEKNDIEYIELQNGYKEVDVMIIYHSLTMLEKKMSEKPAVFSKVLPVLHHYTNTMKSYLPTN
jgi:hypothetical protein